MDAGAKQTFYGNEEEEEQERGYEGGYEREEE